MRRTLNRRLFIRAELFHVALPKTRSVLLFIFFFSLPFFLSVFIIQSSAELGDFFSIVWDRLGRIQSRKHFLYLFGLPMIPPKRLNLFLSFKKNTRQIFLSWLYRVFSLPYSRQNNLYTLGRATRTRLTGSRVARSEGWFMIISLRWRIVWVSIFHERLSGSIIQEIHPLFTSYWAGIYSIR